MLRYRVLLVDTETYQERPVQAFLNTVVDIQSWTEVTLRKASRKAYVVVYRVIETEVAKLVKDDKGSVQGLRPLEKEADKPL